MRTLPLVLLLSLPGVAAAQSADREGTWEAGIKLMDMSHEFIQGQQGASLDIEGELAWAGFERDAFARTAGIPDVFWGFYVQAAYGFFPDILRQVVPSAFDDPGALFTVVVRYDWIDLDDDISDAIEPGLSFRPVPDTVLKFSYRFGLRELGIRNIPGREGFDDSGFIFGFSTYF